VNESERTVDIRHNEILLRRGVSPHRVALEDYVAYGWEATGDVLGQRHARKRDAVILEWLAHAVRSAQKPARVLDVGCAYGDHLFMLQALLGKPEDVEMHGVDLFDIAIARASAFAAAIPGFSNCRFRVADLAEGLPFAEESFDAVNLADVLEHMLDPAAALTEIRRVTRVGGTIIISTPLRDSLFKRAAARANQLTGGRLSVVLPRQGCGGRRRRTSGDGDVGRPRSRVGDGASGAEVRVPESRATCGRDRTHVGYER
jgi:SAM-dependent methyltransferase